LGELSEIGYSSRIRRFLPVRRASTEKAPGRSIASAAPIAPCDPRYRRLFFRNGERQSTIRPARALPRWRSARLIECGSPTRFKVRFTADSNRHQRGAAMVPSAHFSTSVSTAGRFRTHRFDAGLTGEHRRGHCLISWNDSSRHEDADLSRTPFPIYKTATVEPSSVMERAVPVSRGSEPAAGGPSVMNHRIVPVGRHTVGQCTLPGENSSSCGNPYRASFWPLPRQQTAIRLIINHIHLNLRENLQWRLIAAFAHLGWKLKHFASWRPDTSSVLHNRPTPHQRACWTSAS
jgi:hypothetical protein